VSKPHPPPWIGGGEEVTLKLVPRLEATANPGRAIGVAQV
jgi:hypothetical protein